MIDSTPDLRLAVRPDNIEDSFPLSPMQQGILFNSLYYPGAGFELEQLVATLHETVDAAALKKAWLWLVERHAILRTSFSWEGAKPQQHVHTDVEPSWQELDLRKESEAEERFNQYLREDRQLGLDLGTAPITRLALFRFGQAEYRLVWTFHHISIDGRSLNALLQEVFAIYEALRDGNYPPVVAHLPFRDYVEWVSGLDFSESQDYWRSALAGIEPTAIASVFPSRSVDSVERGVVSIRLSKKLTEDFLSRPYFRSNVLHGAWAVLLSRYTSRDDVVFGTIRSGRSGLDGVDDIVGMLINTLPLRVTVPSDLSVLEWLRSIRAAGVRMRPHENAPLALIQQWCGVESSSPLFDTLIGFQSYELNATLRAQGGEWERREFTLHEKAIYPLTVGAYLGDEMLLKFSYDRDRFTADEIERMAGHYVTLLEAMVSDPGRRVSQLPMLSKAEEQKLLVAWNETSAEYPAGLCLHQIYEAHVARQPDSVAVAFWDPVDELGSASATGRPANEFAPTNGTKSTSVDWETESRATVDEESLTYSQLNSKANRLAHYLRGLGVGTESLVALCMQPSLDLIVAILGIHKAGAAYVPLDPSYPPDRLEFMLRDAGVELLVTHENLLLLIPAFDGRIVCLDRDGHLIAEEPVSNPEVEVSVENAAYVIYTSGSTGRPKGVVVTHAGLGNVAANQQRALTIGSNERIVQFASVSFDASVFDIVMSLSTGSTLYLGSRKSLMPGPPLTEFMQRNRITAATLPPTAVGPLNPDDLPELRVLNVAGEACPLELGVRWSAARRFFNLYGPTESTIWASYREIRPDCQCVDIGRPIGNTRLYILDRMMRPVPIGVPGELFIGGISLARGYLNRPDLTAERFVPDPFWSPARSNTGRSNSGLLDSRVRGNDGQLSTRLYRTGDLCRYLPDGNIEFLGRVDQQVKIRGFRIELGEIEAVLGDHPSIEQAVVLAREDTPGDHRLVAYVVGRNGSLDPNELREHLRGRLPDYLTPSAYLSLDSLPLTPSGKIDRKALPIPESGLAVVREQYVAPRTPVEEGLSEIWCEVLRLERVGIHDRFFDLGGHSLLATQVVARVRSAFQVELPLQALFDSPTIAGLADRVTALSGGLIESAPLVPVSRESAIPASFSQQRLWFIHQLDPDSAAYNVPIAWRLTGLLDIAALERALNELRRRHESLRTTFAFLDGAPVQIIESPEDRPLPVLYDATEHRAGGQGTDAPSNLPSQRDLDEVKRLIAEESLRPFDLERGPIFRAGLFRLGPEDHVLLLAMHHIVSDGWSQGVLTRELSALYNGFRSGGACVLPQLPVQYGDYAVWQRERIHGELFETQLAYWKEHLDGASTFLELPVDRRRAPVETFRGAWMPIELSPELTQGLRVLGQREGVTLFMTLMAAYQALLYRYSGQDDFVVGTPIANRTRTEVEGLIGFFVNTLALRADISGNPSFRDLLHRVRETSLGAYANQDLPFERLVEELQPERTLAHSPLFQVVFALQNAPGGGLELDGLQVEDASADWTTAKFDLNLFLTPAGNTIKGALEYNTDLFDADRIERMLSHFCMLLEGVVADPERPISRLPLLTDWERQRVLVDWTAVESASGPEQCLHELFEQQAVRRPDSVAVVCEGERLTYNELNVRANRLAWSLLRDGVGPDTLVGLCMERSVDMVVGVLGILKAGGAYVPLDPTYPADRLAFMVADSGLSIVVTNRASRANVPDSDAAVVCLDDGSLDGENESNPDAGTTVGNLAYVIYTSGSTGRPKGALITHGNVTRLMTSTWKWFQFDESDVWTLFHSLSFDFSVWEIWGPLLYGGRLVVVPYWVSRSPAAFRDLLIDEGVTVLNQTPSAFRQLIQADLDSEGILDSSACSDEESIQNPKSKIQNLRFVIFGGEKLELASLAPWIERYGDEQPQLINMYGITETTVHVTYRRIRAEDVAAGRGSLIGTAIPDLQMYVLGRSMEPVPIGVAGELYVGGAGLARGYLSRAELTAERFVPNPFASGVYGESAFLDSRVRGNDGLRLYRTGDLVRWLPNGDMEYLGRADHQVKIRGFRIELGEIENVLQGHPAVRHAVVIAREDTPDDRRLTAYVVADREYLQAQDELRDTDEQQTADWQAVFESNYSDSAGQDDPTFNIRGWNSSYTGQPIPAAEMREWVDNTVDRILALNPQRVLEIGCGTGLLLFRVAPHAAEYTAVDFSAEALRYVESVLPAVGIPSDRVRLCQSAADSFDYGAVGPNPPDTVVLNSIVQYFPNLDYLLQVLEKSLAILPDGGRIFLGDIRGLGWLEEFQSAVQLGLASPATERSRVWQRVQRAVAEEDELLLDPAFFFALRERFPQIGRVDVELKRGRFWNEMSQFRYDVVLHLGQRPARAEVEWRDWVRDRLSTVSVRQSLEAGPDILAVSGVPNLRVLEAFSAREVLADSGGPATAGDTRAIAESGSSKGVDPEQIWQLADSMGYAAQICPAARPDCFDVIFRRLCVDAYIEFPGHPAGELSTLANDPVRGKLMAAFAPQLREFAAEHLPEYMAPSAFVFLDTLPLTANGKLDRKALPSPDYSRVDIGQGYEAPQTQVEEQLAKIWAEVLRLDRVGRHHDFFELGGHSLLATQAMSRIRKSFDIDLPLRALFETPTIAGLAERIEAVRGESNPAMPPLVPVSRAQPLPLSFSQQRLWFIHQLDPASPAYNFPIALHLVGVLDVPALKSSLTTLIRRHEILRTTFALTDGVASQVIHEPAPVRLPIIDIARPGAEISPLKQLIGDEAVRPFDLEAGPLFRCSLIRVADDEHVLLMTLHHVISDGWSLAVLIRELGALYSTSRAGTPSPLPDLAVQYADYSVWQRSLLETEGSVVQKQLAYWSEKLAGSPALLELPADRPRPSVQSLRGALVGVEIPEQLTQRLNALGQREGATLFMVLLAGFQALLHRYSGQTDIVVGTAIANRTLAETENLLGCFINSLALRGDLSGDPTFRELLARIRETALGAYAHQDLPFEKLVDELQPERNLSYSPIFQTMFLLQNMPSEPPVMSGLDVEQIPPEGFASKVDLTVSLTEEQSRLKGWIEYSTDLFEQDRIERMIGHYVTLLESLVADPGSNISRIAILGDVERHELLEEWTDTTAEYPGHRLIDEMIEEQAERNQDSLAVEMGDRSLTYGELNRRANQLAGYLREQGVGAESRVGVFMQRSPEMLAAILGVLKAGGAYVPIDPDYPAERVAHILSDSRSTVLLTDTAMSPKVAEQSCKVVNVDQLDVDHLPDTDLARVAEPENAAYVIYTSGSTGLPKGVVVSHRNLVHSTTARKRVYEEPPGKFMLLSSIAFDSSIVGIFWTLCEGGCLVLPSRPVQDDLSAVIDQMISSGVTHYLCVPSLHSVILEELGTHRLLESQTSRSGLEVCRPDGLKPESRGLRTVIVAGEECSSRLASQHCDRLPGVNLYNEYGPTETTVWASVWRAVPGSIPDSIPIGRPIANAHCYLLDSRMQPVPIGIPGELYIGGAGVARVYLDRPELTSERFVPNPFASGNNGLRLYRTGDLVRWLPSGELEFLGRVDHQVKIRGFRIELGEVESALLGCGGVREAVVITREDVPGERRLVAYVVGSAQATEMREQLRSRLPEYMVPWAFVVLDFLPLSPNGKVDRNALPAPGESRSDSDYQHPRTSTEEALAEIWREVLRRDQVGIHDNFFELGGDSILSIQIVARANRAGLKLSARQVFEHQTIASLAGAAGTATGLSREDEPASGFVPLTPIQRWLLDSGHPDLDHYNQALLLEMRRSVSPNSVEEALTAVLSHHDAFRLRFSKQGAEWRQEYVEWDGGQFFSYYDLREVAGDVQAETITLTSSDLQSSLNIESGPLVRTAYFDLGADQPARLLIAVHHLVIDGVSWRIVLDDLQTALEQIERGEVVALPSNTTSFKSWAERLADLSQSESVREETGHWLAQVTTHELAADHPDGENTAETEAEICVSLDASTTTALLQQAPAAYHTQINDLLLAALLQAFETWTGERSLLVELEGHGREDLIEDVDLSRTVGWFTTLYPALLELPRGGDLGSAIKSVKEQLRRIPNKGIGYGLLRYLSSDSELVAHLSSITGPQVSFNYLGQFDQVLGDAGLFGLASESPGPMRSARQSRETFLGVIGQVVDGRFMVRWSYSEQQFDRATIERLAGSYIDYLKSLIEHCISADGAYTRSDFPHAVISQESLDRLMAGRSPGDIEDIYSLSPMQAGMLFHTLYASQEGVYLDQAIYTIEQTLNVHSFERAWVMLSARHPALRTSIHWEGIEEPLQVVHREAPIPIDVRDLRNLSPEEQQVAIDEFLGLDRQRGFDLTQPPLLRLTLIRLAEESWRFVWTGHHALMDRWSVALVLDELADLYAAICDGRSIDLPAVRPYGDYIGWIQKQGRVGVEEWWRRNLQGRSAPTTLPIDGNPGGAPGPDIEFERLILSREATASLFSLAREQRLTLSTLIQGAWALTLSRYSGESEALFGATVAGRPASLPGAESMVGMFINSLPARIEVPPKTPTLEWLQTIQESSLQMQEHAHSSLVEIQGWSDIPRGTPLFDSLVVVQNTPASTDSGGDLCIQLVDANSTADFPLMLVVGPADELFLELRYDTDRYDRGAIERMLAHVSAALRGIVTDPNRSVGELDILTADERRQLLDEWTDTWAEYPGERLIHELIEKQAERNPDSLAVEMGDRSLTYAELNRRANQLAGYLREQGMGAESRVGVFMQRSPEMLAAILGVLKAGGAYVPIDPDYPAERVAHILSDSRAAFVLTDTAMLPTFVEQSCKVVNVDKLDLDLLPHTDLARVAEPENAAYVIYTSGSTGLPKGVVVSHRNLVHSTTARKRVYDEPPGKFMLLSSIAFDSSIVGIFWTLCEGGCLVLPSHPVQEALSAVIDQIVSSGVSHYLCVPSLHGVILDELGGRATSLKTVIVAGEECSSRLTSLHCERLPSMNLYNEYGPTEATVWATVWRAEPGSIPDSIPIGRPIANAQCYVLDSRMQPVPVGIPGELYIGGAGVARGYLGRPELTAERFVPNPYLGEQLSTLNSQLSTRLYRTGDLVRWLPSGELEFLGRVDHQVKIRGFRIELGEVESALLGCGGVREAVVIAREDVPGERRLVAYVVGSAQAAEMREQFRSRLPDYMVPSAFVMLDFLPLLPNGKVDRKALLPPDLDDLENGFAAPRNPIEEGIAEIWREVLRLDRVGIHSSFFELGGHSLTATQVVSRIRATFDVELRLRTLFEEPTVAQIAERISMSRAVVSSSPTLTRVSSEGGAPLSYAQQRLYFVHKLDPDSPAYNIPCVLRVEGPLDVALLQQALNTLVNRHEILRTTYFEEDGIPLQIVQPEAFGPLKIVDVSDEAQAFHLAAEESRLPFDLRNGPVMRAALYCIDPNKHLLCLTMHHIASDGWSVGVMVRGLAQLYESGRATELPVQYADYAVWQREWQQSDEMRSQLEYWRQRLDGAPQTANLPFDRPRPRIPSLKGDAVEVDTDPGLLDGLRNLGRLEGATLFMTLLACFGALMYCVAGEEDTVVGTDLAGRNRIELEGMVGFFINHLVLRTDLSGNPTFIEMLGRVRRTALDAYDHQETPFARLVEALQPERASAHTPLFQILFVMQNEMESVFKSGPLTLTLAGEAIPSSKFDLALFFLESEDDGRRRLRANWVYSTDLFERSTIQRMAEQFESVVAHVVARPQIRLAELKEALETDERNRRRVEQERRDAEQYSRFQRLKPRAIS